MIKWIYFLLLIFFQSFLCSAQTVTNAVSHQEQSSIIISYSLETITPCKISLYVSINGGSSWVGPLKKVKGDVGDNISSGEHSIIWSVLEEYKELRGDNIKFQVSAESGSIVLIGEQEWTTRNLDISTYRNGDIIPEVQDRNEWSNLTTGAWCNYENKTENGITYGKLYNWYAVNDRRGLAPLGYHIPSDAEWMTLTTYLGAEPGKQMKSTSGWNKGGNGTNASGFEGLPGGDRNQNGVFNGIGSYGDWWSSSKYTTGALHRYLGYNYSFVNRDFNDKVNGFYVRCLRD